MRLLWPELVWLEAVLPLLVVGYLALLRRRRAHAGPVAQQFLVRNTVTRTAQWRRHVAPGLLLTALGFLVLAAARPTATVTLPSQQQTIILAMDVSGSMQAPDVAPNRISASQTAAKAFASKLPRNVRVGVVAYADSAQLVQPPTSRRDDVLTAIDRFQLQQGTAIGSGILVALNAIFPDQEIDPYDTGARAHKQPRALTPRRAKPEAPRPIPCRRARTRRRVIVLLTDGQNTIGPDPVDAAQLAASRGVKVFTVGFGTKDGEIVGFEGFSILVRLDEDTLQKIAELHARRVLPRRQRRRARPRLRRPQEQARVREGARPRSPRSSPPPAPCCSPWPRRSPSGGTAASPDASRPQPVAPRAGIDHLVPGAEDESSPRAPTASRRRGSAMPPGAAARLTSRAL
jgi:Ca-activated chloride channel family protein